MIYGPRTWGGQGCGILLPVEELENVVVRRTRLFSSVCALVVLMDLGVTCSPRDFEQRLYAELIASLSEQGYPQPCLQQSKEDGGQHCHHHRCFLLGLRTVP